MKRYVQVGTVDGPNESLRRDDALKAMRAAGTNAIPTLLQWIQAEGHPLLRTFRGEYGCARFADNATLHSMAWWGFEFLDGQARSAVPAIIGAMKVSSIESRQLELDCLLRIAPDDKVTLALLQNLLNDPSYAVQRQAAVALLMNYPAETASLYHRFPWLKTIYGETTNLPPSSRSAIDRQPGGQAAGLSGRP